MLGALLLLSFAAAADVLRSGSLPAWRGLAFVLLTSGSSLLMTGLPEYILGISDTRLALPAKVALGPLSGALALTYLGIWMGMVAEDRLQRLLSVAGSFMLLFAAVGMSILALSNPAMQESTLLATSGAVSLVAAFMAGTVALRGMLMGDPLARWMLIACGCLSVMVSGLYAKGLRLTANPWIWVLTALATVLYFFIVIVLTLTRNRSQKRLQKIAQGDHSQDDITGLHTGSVLLSKVDDAMWRSLRAGKETAIVAIWLNNLYALNDQAGQHIEHEIRMRLTANLRRAVGSRNVIGLMQARCYLVVVSAVQDRQLVAKTASRLFKWISQPMQVGEIVGEPMTYTPDVGIGVVFISAKAHRAPLPAMDLAQQLAQAAVQKPERILHEDFAPIAADTTATMPL